MSGPIIAAILLMFGSALVIRQAINAWMDDNYPSLRRRIVGSATFLVAALAVLYVLPLV